MTMMTDEPTWSKPQKLVDLLSPHDQVRVMIAKSAQTMERIHRLFGRVKRGPGLKGVQSAHRGAFKSHKGKPEGYVKPVLVGSTDSTQGAVGARRAQGGGLVEVSCKPRHNKSLEIPACFKREKDFAKENL